MPDEQKPKDEKLSQPAVPSGETKTDTYGMSQEGAADKPKLNFLKSLLNKNEASTDTPVNGNGNAFTKLFSSNGNGNSAQPKPVSEPDVQKAAPSISSLLGPAPEFSPEALEKSNNKMLKAAKFICQISVLAAICVFVFFYSQLNPNFTLFSDQLGPNIAMNFNNSNIEIANKQTELNLVRFNIARLWLDDIAGKTDAFLHAANVMGSDSATSLEKQAVQNDFTNTKENLKNSFREVQKILAQPIGIDTFSRTPVTQEQREQQFEELLKTRLANEKNASAGDTASDKENLRRIDNIIRLVDNKRLRNTIVNYDFGKVSDEDLVKLLSKIREEGTDELSLAGKIKALRINWGKVIKDLETVTRKADLYYGQGLFRTVGGFLFSSYRFDAQAGRIGITGLTRTSDSKTFSFIAKLVDNIEKSSAFKDIDFRSFSKTRDDKGDYSSSINLDFAIQSGPDPRDEDTNQPTQ